MTAPAARWAASPRDGCCHAFEPAQADGAAERGLARAVCGHEIRARLIVSDVPSGAPCLSCVALIAELPQPRVPQPREGGPG